MYLETTCILESRFPELTRVRIEWLKWLEVTQESQVLVGAEHMTACAVLRHRTPAGVDPPGNLFVPAGSKSERFVEVTNWTAAVR